MKAFTEVLGIMKSELTARLTPVSLRLSITKTHIIASLVVFRTDDTEAGKTVNSNLYVPVKKLLKRLFSHMYCLHRGLHRSGVNCTTSYVLPCDLLLLSICHFNDHRLTRISTAISHQATNTLGRLLVFLISFIFL